MSLILNKKAKYASSYFTNWYYLHNMTRLQVKPLNEIIWSEFSKHIHTGLWDVPNAWKRKKDTKDSVKGTIKYFNNEIKRL